MKLYKYNLLLLLLFLLTSCMQKNEETQGKELETKMNAISERYVKLVLNVGLHDPDYVDAYYGPPEWKPQDSSVVANDSVAIQNLYDESGALLDSLENLASYKANELETLRHKYLYKQIIAVRSRIFMLAGGIFSFDEEVKNLYDAVAPVHDDSFFVSAIEELEKSLPGTGELSQRLSDFKNGFVIPIEKLDTVFQAAINECRKRTLQHISLPRNENFTVEYVKDAPWGAYNWYKGNSFSLIQVNTSLPVYIDRAVDLAAHEGYPGHHVYNALLEKEMVRDRGWMEFSVYPLFSPQSLIAEGSANYGIHVAFPGNSRIQFEKEVLFPLAGLDASKADLFYKILGLQSKLSFAGNEAARKYIDGKITRDEAKIQLQKFSLMSLERAEQRMRFVDKYRSYIVNYNLGEEIVKDYITRNGGTDDNPDKRWKLIERLLSTPQVPSNLK